MRGVLKMAILALGTLGSSWAAYQSARWNGVQAQSFQRAGADRSESVRASNRGHQLEQVDVAAFATWLLAVGQGNHTAARFLRERFRAEFAPVFEAWLASAPSDQPVPRGTPFQRPEYHPAALQESARLLDRAESQAATGQRANQVSDNYMFSIVMFSTVIFLAGVDRPHDGGRRTRLFFIVLPICLFVFAVAFMVRQPVTIGF